MTYDEYQAVLDRETERKLQSIPLADFVSAMCALMPDSNAIAKEAQDEQHDIPVIAETPLTARDYDLTVMHELVRLQYWTVNDAFKPL